MPSTRDRILVATGELFRRQGYNGTSMKQVIEAAGVPFGSLYHHFPGGKIELAEAVIRTSGSAYRQVFELIWAESGDPVGAITSFFEGAADLLEATDFVDACPIGTVALEVASTDDRLRRATSAAFDDWIDAATIRLRDAGLVDDQARELATVLVAAVEGGFMLSRAARTGGPMRAAGRSMAELAASALMSSTSETTPP